MVCKKKHAIKTCFNIQLLMFALWRKHLLTDFWEAGWLSFRNNFWIIIFKGFSHSLQFSFNQSMKSVHHSVEKSVPLQKLRIYQVCLRINASQKCTFWMGTAPVTVFVLFLWSKSHHYGSMIHMWLSLRNYLKKWWKMHWMWMIA